MLLPNATELVPPSPSCGMVENKVSARSRRFLSGSIMKVDRNLQSAKYFTTINRRDPTYKLNQPLTIGLSMKALTCGEMKIPNLNVPKQMVLNIPLGHAIKVNTGTQTHLPNIDEMSEPVPVETKMVSEACQTDKVVKPQPPKSNQEPSRSIQSERMKIGQPIKIKKPENVPIIDKKMHRSAELWENLVKRPVPSRPDFSEPIQCKTPHMTVFPPDFTRLRMPVFDHVVKDRLRRDYIIHPDFISESLRLPYIEGQSSNPLKYGWVG